MSAWPLTERLGYAARRALKDLSIDGHNGTCADAGCLLQEALEEIERLQSIEAAAKTIANGRGYDESARVAAKSILNG